MFSPSLGKHIPTFQSYKKANLSSRKTYFYGICRSANDTFRPISTKLSRNHGLGEIGSDLIPPFLEFTSHDSFHKRQRRGEERRRAIFPLESAKKEEGPFLSISSESAESASLPYYK